MALIECDDCGEKISENTNKCPKCGYKVISKREKEKKVATKFGLIGAGIGAVIGGILCGVQGEILTGLGGGAFLGFMGGMLVASWSGYDV